MTFREIWARFWSTYLSLTGDRELLTVVAPFFAWRALVLANPIWYPNLDTNVRAALLRFAENVLLIDQFNIMHINAYLAIREGRIPG